VGRFRKAFAAATLPFENRSVLNSKFIVTLQQLCLEEACTPQVSSSFEGAFLKIQALKGRFSRLIEVLQFLVLPC